MNGRLRLVLSVLTLFGCSTSGQDGDSNVGPALRPYREAPVSRQLVVETVGKVEEGTEVVLQVKLPERSNKGGAKLEDEIVSCVWTTPEGQEYLWNGTDPLVQDNPDDQLAAETTADLTGCKVKIPSLKPAHLGDWKCRVLTKSTSRFQDAFVTLSETGRSSSVRLPAHVAPEQYAVYLTPFIEVGDFSIQGHVDIDIGVVREGGNNITLHVERIEVFENLVKVARIGGDGDDNDNQLDISGFGYDEARQFFIVYLAEDLEAGQKVRLSVDFASELGSDPTGFYRSWYYDEEKKAREYLATTQFEATGARRAMPCFDEPALKAVFKVNLGRQKDMTSISNMPHKSVGLPMKDNDVYVWDTYQDTPVMPTYLLAFVISRYVAREGKPSSSGVQFKFWSRNSVLEQTAFATEISPKILDLYEKIYNVSYPMPKVDFAAIQKFGASGMENWGLITYKESVVTYNPEKSTQAEKEKIVHLTAHELAHQWFGNLVTMDWWTDLWLNECFALYMQYIAVNHVLDDGQDSLDIFQLRTLHPALEKDAFTTSHPVSVPVNHPAEIVQIFDSISYNKGASVVRMLANILGFEVFNRGIEHYLRKHQYGNAKQDDLWQALTEVGQSRRILSESQNLKEVMDTWTLQMGYPVVTAIRNYDSNEVTFTQKRFLVSQDESADAEDLRWWVPISYTTVESSFNETKTKSRVWLEPKEDSRTVSLEEEVSSERPIFINVQQTGFYRVNYDDENWSKISGELLSNHPSISRLNRAQILDDSLTLARAGLLSYRVALGTTDYLAKELDFIPWKAALNKFAYLDTMLGRTEDYEEFRKFLVRLVKPVYEHLGFDPKATDSHFDTRLREEAVQLMCTHGYPDCVERAAETFDQWTNPRRSRAAPGDAFSLVSKKYTVYCSVVANGGDTEFNYFWSKILADSDGPSERTNYLAAVACTRDEEKLKKLLEESADDNSAVKETDLPALVESVARNRVARAFVWSWFKDNWKRLSSKFSPGGPPLFGNLVTAVTESLYSDLEVADLTAFTASVDLGPGQRSASGAVQSARSNALWMKTHLPEVVSWLKVKNEAAAGESE